MGKYFGTDGIRGRVNVTLDAKRAFDIGRYLGYYYSGRNIIVGKDTRLSGSMFEMALASGIVSSGANVYLLGYCSTPAIAYLTKNEDFKCGVMISASHNPYYDNGIKIFSHDGIKISEDIEKSIEDYIDGNILINYATEDSIGRVFDYEFALSKYIDYLYNLYELDLKGFNIAIDCANGSSFVTAKKLFERLNANCTVINDNPNGVNINTNCGSTHPNSLQELVKNGNYDIGLAFDGDADRLIAVDNKGNLINGDYIIYICAKYLKERNQLTNNTVVTTVMANLGLFKALDKLNIKYVSTKVGDKYVYDEMVKNSYDLGGEQSGHIIFSKNATTGDGLLTALNLIKIIKETNLSLNELGKDLLIYPQLLVNVEVKDKDLILNNPDINEEINLISKELNTNGRILVRGSGTEPLIRVMVEAENNEICIKMVKRVTDMIDKTHR